MWRSLSVKRPKYWPQPRSVTFTVTGVDGHLLQTTFGYHGLMCAIFSWTELWVLDWLEINNSVCAFRVMKEHLTEYNIVAHWCVFGDQWHRGRRFSSPSAAHAMLVSRDVPIRIFCPWVRVISFSVSVDIKSQSDTSIIHKKNEEERRNRCRISLIFFISFTLFSHLTLRCDWQRTTKHENIWLHYVSL